MLNVTASALAKLVARMAQGNVSFVFASPTGHLVASPLAASAWSPATNHLARSQQREISRQRTARTDWSTAR
jgi:hypothetical protein